MSITKEFYMVNKEETKEVLEKAIKENNQDEFTLCEISKEGNIQVFMVGKRFTKSEIVLLEQSNAHIHYLERKGKSAILVSGVARLEMHINPSLYKDDRYELLKSKDKVNVEIYMYDSYKKEFVATRVVEFKNATLRALKKSLELNEKYSKEEYFDWISNVLFANKFDTNRKFALYIGRCENSQNEIVLL